MLRGEVVRERNRRLHLGGAQDLYLAGEHAAHQAPDVSGDRRIGADEDGARVGRVLGLGAQVGRHPGRGHRSIGQDQDFRRTGRHINGDLAEHGQLGGSHVGVARSEDLVDPAHGLGAVRHGRDRLRAPDGVDLGHAREPGGREDRRGNLPIALRRRTHDDLLAAGEAGRDGEHEDGRRVNRAPAGHVEPDAPQRTPLSPDTHAPHHVDRLLAEALRAVNRLDVRGRDLEGASQSEIEIVQRRAHGLGGDAGLLEAHAIEALGQVEQCRVAALSDVE